jgi:alpha/beta superfamily hydrolase
LTNRSLDLFPLLFTLLSLALCSASSCRPRPGAADTAEGLLGRWETVPAVEPEAAASTDPIRLEFFREAEGVAGRLSLPAKALYDLPLEELVVRRRTIRFRVRMEDADYALRGAWSGDRILGSLTTLGAGGRRELELAKQVEPVVPYEREEVVFEGAVGVLAGTLTLPHERQPDVGARPDSATPAVVLVSPAGPHNRDAEINGFAFFSALADLLTRQGITVLRYDDRGVGRSTGTIDDGIPASADDARRAAQFLGAHEQTERVGLMGCREGGLAAVHAAERADPAFVVLVDAPVAGYPLTAELEEMPCPLLAVWSGTAGGAEHMEAFVSILERSEHPDYTARRFPAAEELFRSAAPPAGPEPFVRLDPTFRRFLLRWLEVRVRRLE